MSKKLKLWEFQHYLMKIKLKKSSNLLFVQNYFAFEADDKYRTLYGYLVFLKHQLDGYRISITMGEIDFQTYLNEKFPVIQEFGTNEESKLDQLDNHLRENFVEEQKISIKELLELIEEFQD